MKALELIDKSSALRDRLWANTWKFREGIQKLGFPIKPGETPIVPVMLGEAKLAQDFAAGMLEEGIYVIGFFNPVVAKGQARIRVQLSAAHEPAHVDRALEAFGKVGKRLGVV